MSDRGPEPRTGRRSAVLGGRQATADWGGRAGELFYDVFEWLAARLGEEADAARLAVCFGIGILLYFAAPAEPSLYAPAIPFVLLAGIAWASRERPFAFALALALTAIASGFGAGCLRSALVAHPMLTRATGTVTRRATQRPRAIRTTRLRRICRRTTSRKATLSSAA